MGLWKWVIIALGVIGVGYFIKSIILALGLLNIIVIIFISLSILTIGWAFMKVLYNG